MHASALVLPVFRVFRSFGSHPYGFALPGRHDQVTLADGLGTMKEMAEINYAWAAGPVEDWHGGYAHLAFNEALSNEFLRTTQLSMLDDTDQNSLAQSIEAQYILNSESRGFTRILKFPSGELPSVRFLYGKVDSMLAMGTTELVPVLNICGPSRYSFVNFLLNVVNAFDSAALRTPFRPGSTITNLRPLLPITAPSPPRPACRAGWRSFSASVHATDAPFSRIS